MLTEERLLTATEISLENLNLGYVSVVILLLVFDNTFIRDKEEDLNHLLEALQRNNNVKHLSLAHNRLKDKGMKV